MSRAPTLPDDLAQVSFRVLATGAIVTAEPGSNTEAFRARLYAWADEHGATKDGRINAWRFGSLLARVER